VLAVWLAAGPRSVRNGADVILQGLFTAVAGRWGPPLFMICLIGGGLWLVARDTRAHGSRPQEQVFLGMLAESLLLALAFGSWSVASLRRARAVADAGRWRPSPASIGGPA